MSARIVPSAGSRLVVPPKDAAADAASPAIVPAFPQLDVEQVRQILPQLIDALTEAVVVVDLRHRVVAANRRFAEAFGFLGDKVVGTLCHEALACPELDQNARAGGCAACDVVKLREPRRLLRSLSAPRLRQMPSGRPQMTFRFGLKPASATSGPRAACR